MELKLGSDFARWSRKTRDFLLRVDLQYGAFGPLFLRHRGQENRRRVRSVVTDMLDDLPKK